jgi:hypothetical protein
MGLLGSTDDRSDGRAMKLANFDSDGTGRSQSRDFSEVLARTLATEFLGCQKKRSDDAKHTVFTVVAKKGLEPLIP